jgi:transposase
MASTQARSRRLRTDSVHKPRGNFHPRVQQAGPEHFGIVAIDCAKDRSKWMLTDFFGTILAPPTVVAHRQPDFRRLAAQLERLRDRHQLRDTIVAIERTGEYHQHLKRFLISAGFEVRTVHPFATKTARLAVDPGNKTDDTDLMAIYRAAINGFALQEPSDDPLFLRLQLLERRRRALVRDNAAARCRIREHLHAYLPGYSNCFSDLFINNVGLVLPRHYASAAAIAAAGMAGLERTLDDVGVRYQARSLRRVLAWAAEAAAAGPVADTHQYLFVQMDQERRARLGRIAELEAESLTALVRTPYVLLLGIPGLNVVSTAELAGEMGPIDRYANARTITGRAGLYPARYQSDQVDRCHGQLVRSRNRSLRNAIMTIADSLLACNAHFRALGAGWREAGQDERTIRVKAADRFCRIAYQVVAGRQVFRHPCTARWDYIAEKVVEYTIIQSAEYDHVKFNISDLLKNCLEQLPESERAQELRRLRDRAAGTVPGTSTGRPSRAWAALEGALVAEGSSSRLEYPRSGGSISELDDRPVDPNNAVCPRGAKP